MVWEDAIELDAPYVLINGEKYYVHYDTEGGTAISADNLNAMQLEMHQKENPVGHIRLELTNINPATYLGFGKWVLFGKGKCLVGIDENDTDFNTVEKTGGEKTHTLLETEMPKHRHHVVSGNTGSSSDIDSTHSIAQYATSNQSDLPYSLRQSGEEASKGRTSESGGGQAHNNLQPYITCYMWKRIA